MQIQATQNQSQTQWPHASPTPPYSMPASLRPGPPEYRAHEALKQAAHSQKRFRVTRAAFRDFEVAAKQGYKPGWFKLGRDYKSVKDVAHARNAFERGARSKESSCLYVSLSAAIL